MTGAPSNSPPVGTPTGSRTATIAIRCTPDIKDFAITAAPAMPAIQFHAAVVGATPPAPASTLFDWTVTLSFNPLDCKHGAQREIAPVVLTGTTSGPYTPLFNDIRGGTLSVRVKAKVNGMEIVGERTDLRIIGTNPKYSQLTAAIPSRVFRALVWHESRGRQFLGPADGGTSACPLFSGDNLGGVGLMQLTRPAPTVAQIWDWTANVAGGLALFQEKTRVARAYPQQTRNGQAFKTLVADFNADRVKRGLPALPITLPDFTAEQVELDALRGYNGWAGGLHEYRVARDAARGLLVTVSADGRTGTASWEQVPAGDRPKAGDPNYVRNVMQAVVPY